LPPRVLHIVPTLGQGGAERVLSNLVTGTTGRAGHEVITILNRPAFFDLPGVAVTSLAVTSPANLWRVPAALRAHIRAARPDVIQSWLYYGNLFSVAALGLNVPVLWSIHNTTLSRTGSKWGTRAAARLGAPLSRHLPTRIHYCSESARILHETAGYDPTRSVVIENGIAMDNFRFAPERRVAIRQALGIGADVTLFGVLGRFDPQKNHALVLDALMRLPTQRPWRLLLAGNGCGPDNGELTALIDSHGATDRVQCLGERRDVRDLLSAMDVLVIGSSFGEALPMVAIEATASGLPVVATRVGDVAPFVVDPAHLVPPDDAAAMALALRDAASFAQSHDRTRRDDDPRQPALARFTVEHMVERFLALYTDLAGR
jgi:glycosyltransferase involved in cell wall biosynthesis